MYEDWRRGDALAIGRAIMADVPATVQVARALAVLGVCRSRSPIPEIERVIAIAAETTRRRDGHDAFRAVRALTLREERERTNDVYRALLYVAEIVAKLTYNASGEPAPFDADSPWWLASNARHFVTALDDESVARDVWHALIG